MRGKVKSLLNEKKIVQGTLGNWLAAHLKYEDKTIIATHLHRIPSLSQHGLTCSITQCNRKEGNGKKKGITIPTSSFFLWFG